MEYFAVHYYYRKKWFNTVIRESANNGEPVVVFFRSYSLVAVDRVSEALDCLKPFINQPKYLVAALMASIYAHNHCQVLDREAVETLEKSLRAAKKSANSDPYFNILCWYLEGNYNKALPAVEELTENDSRAFALHGWILLGLKKIKAALRQFTTALKLDKNNADALSGEIACLGPTEALNKVNSLVVKFPKGIVPLMEKFKVQLMNRQWDSAVDTVLRTLSIQPDNINANQVRALKALNSGKYDEAATILSKIYMDLEKQEPQAFWIFTENISVFSRCCGGEVRILNELEPFVHSALKTGSFLLPVLIEIGNYHFVCGHFKEAGTRFAEAAKLDESSIALSHLTKVRLAENGLTREVREQIDFLIELDGRKENPELLLLKAISNESESIELLDRAISVLQTKASQHSFGVDYLIELNPELLMRIARAYPSTISGEKRRLRVLRLIVENCPGLTTASLEIAQTQIRIGEYQEAELILTNLTENDSTNPQAHLLLTKVYIDMGDHEKAASQLGHGLSNDLLIRELPLFHLLNGLIEKSRGSDAGCINSMQQAINISNKGTHKLGSGELGTAYAELSRGLLRQNELKKAEEVLKEANELFKGSQQESSVSIAAAQLAVKEGDIRRALKLLSTVSKDDPNFMKAQIEKADIFLNNLKDGLGYADCYKKLVEANPTAENLLLLGDAYMSIQEPELAVESYEKAVRSNSGNTQLCCKLARVLVRCHEYQKAINCYKASGEDGSIELAELLIKLGQLDKAEQALNDLQLSKKALTLAKIHEKSGDIEAALKILKEAQESGRGDMDWSTKLCQHMAVYSNMVKDHNAAIDYYKRALKYSPADVSTQIALAKLYMEVNDWSSCETLCKSLLAKDPFNEPALLMVADLSLRRVDFNSAMNHFSSLLTRRPDYWVALARLIEVARRSAMLEQALPFLEAAKSMDPNHPGLHYCTGLYHWYRGETQKAVQNFNGARGDSEWGSQAVHNMIELCMGQSAAHKLLAELKPQTPDEENGLLLLTNFVRLSTRDRSEVERAIVDLTNLVGSDSHRVGATLGLGMGYMEQGQANRAKVVLKRVAKNPWNLEEAEYLERCWLLLGELYIQGGSQQQASDLLHRVITHNQSSAKAYELLGMIAEKEQNYLKAGQLYLQSWNLSGQSNPSLGYKLAFNQLKSKKYSDSVATCQKVLALHPDYPKIRKDILDKAMPRLRS